MTLAEAREAIYERWETEWDDETPFCFEGEVFEEPDVAWARVTVRHLDSTQDTLGRSGERQFRRQAAIIVQLFSPAIEARGPLDALADTARAIWEGVSFDGINALGGVQITELPTDGRWLQTNVEALVDYYEVL